MPTEDPTGTYSLGRTQMALWLVLSVAGFIFLWLTLGFYINVITSAILVLLGINGVTGLAAILIDKPDPAAVNPAPARTSQGLPGGSGLRQQRRQAAAYPDDRMDLHSRRHLRLECFLELRICGFRYNLLLLMEIASSTYLGFKTQEKR